MSRSQATSQADNTAQQQQQQSSSSNKKQRRSIVFVHLDWGIGGAEQLMLQLVQAVEENAHVELVTTRCDPDHCFAALKVGQPLRDSHLHIWGSWIPDSIFGKGQALFSTIRLLYLALCVAHAFPNCDWIVTDVLPTSLWMFRYFTTARVFFYCHFPDQLLLRQQQQKSRLQTLYRSVLDALEEQCMQFAHVIAVNSKFTQQIVQKTFTQLQQHALPVLYPALDDSSTPDIDSNQKHSNLFVSLNRFERKKNLDILLHAVAHLQQEQPKQTLEVVIAGGYDPRNVENVEYRGELGQLAEKLSNSNNVKVTFRQSISDAERTELLQQAAAVVYTPENEHFGIVPLEAMFHGAPVIACNSGGPKETILHQETGWLCPESTPAAFAQAMSYILQDPKRAVQMGRRGHEHVVQTFGMERLQREFLQLLSEYEDKHELERYRVLSPHALLILLETLLVFLACLGLTWVLRASGVLEPGQSILSGVRTVLTDEL